METLTLARIGGALTAIGWLGLPVLLLPLLLALLPRSLFLRSLARHVITILDAVSYHAGEIIKWALVLLVIVTVAAVIALSIFGVALTKFDELPIYLHAAVILLGSAATLLAGQHVRVDIFYSRFTPDRRALIDLIGFYAFAVPFCVALIWTSQSFVGQSWISLEGSSDTNGLRGVYLLKTCLPVFAVLIVLQGLSIACRAVLALQGHARPQRPEHIPPLFGHAGQGSERTYNEPHS